MPASFRCSGVIGVGARRAYDAHQVVDQGVIHRHIGHALLKLNNFSGCHHRPNVIERITHLTIAKDLPLILDPWIADA